jgi:hypothetical protein
LQLPKVLGATTSQGTDKLFSRLIARQALVYSKLCFRIPNLPKNLPVLEQRRQRSSQVSFYFFATYYLLISDVLAPHSIDQVLKEVDGAPFSISIDASNHGVQKMFPVVIR